MSSEKTPVLSKKRQNRSLSNKKKPLKTIKNLLTSHRALYWPVINEHEKKSIMETFKSIVDENKEGIKPTAFKSKLKNSIKFGVSEIYKCSLRDECSAVLLDSEVPRILVLHILSTVITKRIPVLCIPELNVIIKSLYGFNGNSLCITRTSIENYPHIIEVIKNIYEKSYKLPDVEETLINVNKTVISKTDHKSVPNESQKTPSEVSFIQFSDQNDEPVIKMNGKRKRKGPSFQPLIIKRIKNNPNR